MAGPEVINMADAPRRLYRSRTDRKLFGVLGGLADFFGLDPSLVRIVYAVVTVFTAFVPGILLYWLMVFIVPLEAKNGG
jgi:phage shock protein PspC (stress-responsive transcriptional regulator)